MRTRDEEGRREGESIAKNGGENGGKRRGARTAMRRRLRHHGGVHRISCESGNSSQLTAGRTASPRVEGGEATLRLCDNQYSAPAPRARHAFSLSLSFPPFLCDLPPRIILYLDILYPSFIARFFSDYDFRVLSVKCSLF